VARRARHRPVLRLGDRLAPRRAGGALPRVAGRRRGLRRLAAREAPRGGDGREPRAAARPPGRPGGARRA
jgi:hypothetical protein